MDENGKKGRHSDLPLRMAFGKRKACAPREGHNVFGFLVRADTAVRPYAEYLPTMPIQCLSDVNSNIENDSVGAGFYACPLKRWTKTAKRAGTVACPYEWLLENERHALHAKDIMCLASRRGRTRRSAPTQSICQQCQFSACPILANITVACSPVA
jgi:hypothetical protein